MGKTISIDEYLKEKAERIKEERIKNDDYEYILLENRHSGVVHFEGSATADQLGCGLWQAWNAYYDEYYSFIATVESVTCKRCLKRYHSLGDKFIETYRKWIGFS